MKVTEFIQESAKTAIYPNRGAFGGVIYVAAGLAGETGELFEVLKKILRDNDGQLTPAMVERLKKEAGDVLWYWSQMLYETNCEFKADDNTDADEFQQKVYDFYIGDNEKPAIDDPSIILQQMYLLSAVQKDVSNIMGIIVGVRSAENFIRAVDEMRDQTVGLVRDLSVFLANIDISLGEVMQMNLDKLSARMEAGKIGGDGEELDER